MRTILTAALALCASAPGLTPSADAAKAAQTSDERPDIVVSREDRDLAIGNLARTIREQHFSAETGERIARQIERKWRGGGYSLITSGRLLAATLTADLRAFSGDQHFLVDYFARARPFPVPAGDAAEAQQRQDFSLANYGIRSAERLDGNIGYLRIDRFAPAQDSGPALLGAMAMLGSTSALIIDLRHNGGGYGDTAALLAGQLLPEPMRMSDIVARDGVKQVWTPFALSGRYLDKPVYVLTSARTFSAAEGLAFFLKEQGRAKIVGEVTRGGANPVSRVLLSSRFWTLVPVAHAKSPATGGSWEGTGVTPDIKVAADQALTAAQKDAARQLLGWHKDDPITKELEALLAAK